jgi:hypothetical protein
MQKILILFFLSTCVFVRDPFVYQSKPRIIAEGQINGEEIKVIQNDDIGIKIKRKKSPSTEIAEGLGG